jgi:hypothetical protein
MIAQSGDLAGLCFRIRGRLQRFPSHYLRVGLVPCASYPEPCRRARWHTLCHGSGRRVQPRTNSPTHCYPNAVTVPLAPIRGIRDSSRLPDNMPSVLARASKIPPLVRAVVRLDRTGRVVFLSGPGFSPDGCVGELWQAHSLRDSGQRIGVRQDHHSRSLAMHEVPKNTARPSTRPILVRFLSSGIHRTQNGLHFLLVLREQRLRLHEGSWSHTPGEVAFGTTFCNWHAPCLPGIGV